MTKNQAFILKYLLLVPSLFLGLTFVQAQEQRIRTSDGVELYLKVAGKGIPCLYIHGGPGAGSYWMEAFAGDLLEERFQMYYLDLRGVGRSTSPTSGDYSMDRMGQDFEEIRRQMGVEKWLIMSHSFSGTLATGYAHRHPESLMGIMMFNSTLDLQQSIRESWIPKACDILGIRDRSYYENDAIAIHEKLNRLFAQLNEKDLGWKMAFASKADEERMNATYSNFPNWNGDFSAIGLSHEDYLQNFKPLTADIELPVLFFYGKKDWTVGPQHHRGVHFPNMLLWGSKTGHIPFLENKKDVARAIDRYLERFIN